VSADELHKGDLALEIEGPDQAIVTADQIVERPIREASGRRFG
jgi:hypothetical protein